MFVRQSGDGDWYVCSVPIGLGKGRGIGRRGRKRYRNWFLIKFQRFSGQLNVGNITFPKEFAGEKIRLKVEIIPK